jgi:hypothetical protein
MSSSGPPVLQRLHRLDRSSHNFREQLRNVLYGREYKQCLPNLQDDDLMWLVDYLDGVRRRFVLPRSPLKPVQALVGLDLPSPASRKCLRELRSICGTRAILPTSYKLSPDLLKVDPDPFAFGGFGDVYHGTLDDSRVCVKRVRVYTKEGPQKAAKVRH